MASSSSSGVEALAATKSTFSASGEELEKQVRSIAAAKQAQLRQIVKFYLSAMYATGLELVRVEHSDREAAERARAKREEQKQLLHQCQNANLYSRGMKRFAETELEKERCHNVLAL